MRVLIVTFAFPPSNVVGAVRVGKFARHLDRRGHDVRVLTTDIIEDRSLPLEIAKEQVIYTDYRQRGGWLDRAVRRLGRGSLQSLPGSSNAPPEGGMVRPSLRSKLRRHYHGLIHLPDMRADWIEAAIPAGRGLVEQWRPDIILASAPPFTGLIIASRLGRMFSIPWVADFRDLWVDNPYYDQPGWRRPVDALLERLTLRDAAALVTVSPNWADQLRRRHGKTAEVVYNGYAEEDFPEPLPVEDSSDVLTIRYMGSIYRGFRDPSVVFAAVASLPHTFRNRTRMEFYGDLGEEVLAAASRYRIADRVAVRPRIPYRRALALQMQADILLLLQSNDRRDEGNLPAKLFEYLFARRPILFIGYEHGIAARFVVERGAGLVSNDPQRIRDQLQGWIEEKRSGRLAGLKPSVSEGLSRTEQFDKLEGILLQIFEADASRNKFERGSRKSRQSVNPSSTDVGAQITSERAPLPPPP